MLRVSVSDLDQFKRFREDEEYPLGVFLADLRRETPPTPAMQRGHAFAVAMEHASLGETSTISAEGHTFAFTCDAEIESWPRREEKREKDYGGVTVTARCDRIMGRTVADDKTTSQFDAEAYMDKYQWRFYLDMFEADVFKWHVWETREIKPGSEDEISPLYKDEITTCAESHAWEVYSHHLLTQYRYKELENDCRQLAQDFKIFAEQVGWAGRASHYSDDVGEAVSA